ncbi:MAG: 3'(2'), 5'-bisphosphate nucleotidase [Saprospiraceae bacterium]|jgi:3'(2'), 5'-bisphosphate nucleotidase
MHPTLNKVQTLPEIINIARAAGKAILEVYESMPESGLDFKTKGDGSPLTIADQKAHLLIEAALQKLTPQIPILSEESYHEVGDKRLNWPIYWLVDPLDGTKEFIKRNGEFTVNIALIENRKPVLGVVHTPIQGVTHFGTVEGGAFIQAGDQAPTPIRTAPLSRDNAIIVASRSHMSDEVKAFQANLATQIKQVECISMGSSLKLCLVAEGKADYYPRLGLTSEWDTGAAQCVVEAAGGKVVAPNGEQLLYSKSDILNPWFLVIGDTSVEIDFEGMIT